MEMLDQARKHDAGITFDPARRASLHEIDEAVKTLAEHPLVSAVLDSANVSMVVVNPELQVVAANRSVLKTVGAKDVNDLMGMRLGEMFGCANANIEDDGCGASQSCSHCGSSRVVLESQRTGLSAEGECVLVTDRGGGQRTSDLSLRATPVNLGNKRFTVVAMQDITDGKRRLVLERIFIHDLNNTLIGLIGWSEILLENPTEEPEQAARRIRTLTARLAREVEEHRVLLAVEAEEYSPERKAVMAGEVLANIQAIFEHHEASQGKELETLEMEVDVELLTDAAMVERVLTNMVKNALEATPPGGTARMGCAPDNDAIKFSVWNESTISEEISGRIFDRSFSTKNESGRGLGTYSMKLFGERCLGGKVWFTSSEDAGTTFYLELPLSLS